MIYPSVSSKTYLFAYAGLLALLLANVLIGYLNLGWASMFIAITIAALQVSIIVLVLMHGIFEKALIRLIMGGALLWFLIMITLTMTDYITRNWVPIAGK